MKDKAAVEDICTTCLYNVVDDGTKTEESCEREIKGCLVKIS